MNDTPRCYTVAEIRRKLSLSSSSFYVLKAAGEMPFLEEIQPRLGRLVRYRAEPVDRYIANKWTGPRAIVRAS